MRARRSTVRAAVTAGASCLALGMLALSGASPGTAAPGGKAGAGVPPGQAKKVAAGGAAQGAQPGGPGASGQAAQGSSPQKAAKPVESHPAKAQPSKAARPGKARGPKRAAPAAAAPAQSAPAVAPSAPSSSQPALATAPRRQASTPTAAPRRRSAAQRPAARERNARARAERGARSGAPPAGATAGDRTASTGGAGAIGAPAADDRAARSQGNTDAESEPAGAEASPVAQTVLDIVEVVPGWVKVALGALAALALALAAGYVVTAMRARTLARQRGELLRDVGLLQSALLPPVPNEVGALRTSVAYRPADGPGAGGDFYDVVSLPDGRAGFVLGDISGHGRDAIERTAFMRYTLRAYLEAGLEPRIALQVAGRVIGDDLGGDFATVVLAVHDPGSGSLTYATAGHPAPIVGGGGGFEPVVSVSSPPIGIGEPTGMRQTTVPLASGAVACLFTDGLIEARTADGLLGRERLEAIVAALGPEATAEQVIERVATEARSASDDMAACLLTPTAGVTTGGFRTEQLELSADEAGGPLPSRFLSRCGVVDGKQRRAAQAEIHSVARDHGGAVLNVTFGNRRTVTVLPRNVESIEAAARRAAASARAG